ncbi:MAG: c-type cytochrome [Cyanobium sp.]
MQARPVSRRLCIGDVFWSIIRAGLLLLLLFGPAPAWAESSRADLSGAELFANHCAGCHVNGGNIIRRGKNLKLAALERNGIGGPEQIAAIAAAGQGQMSGYGAVLGAGGPEAVAAYVWQQAQLDWPRA